MSKNASYCITLRLTGSLGITEAVTLFLWSLKNSHVIAVIYAWETFNIC